MKDEFNEVYYQPIKINLNYNETNSVKNYIS
jgi:hypothetical protein